MRAQHSRRETGAWLSQRIAVIALGLLSLAPSPSSGASQTPAKKKVVFFAATSFPEANDFEVVFKRRSIAEGYTFVSYLNGANPKQATIENFYNAAAARNYAMFIIVCHGSENNLLLEEFPDATTRDAALNNYQNGSKYKAMWALSAKNISIRPP